MTARRGSLRYKIVRLARAPHGPRQGLGRGWRVAVRAAALAGRAVFALAVLFIAGTLAAQVWRVGQENVQLHDQIVRTQQENQALAAQSAHLSDRISKLHDPEYLVPLIHEQLGLTKPNEIFVDFQPEPAQPNASPRN